MTNHPEAVVLVHGWGSGSGVWDPLVSRWWSGEPRRHPDFYAARDADELLPCVLRALPDEPACVVGWSMGALLAMEAALAQPASVRALVLIGGTPRFVSDDPLAGWPERVLRRMQRRLRSDAPAVLREFHARMFAPGEAPQAEEFAAAYPIPDAVNFSVEGLAAGLDYLAATDLRPGLVRLRCPVLWIHGGQDRICPLKALDGLPAEHRKRVVESAGHLPFWTHPEETAQAIREFRSHA